MEALVWFRLVYSMRSYIHAWKSLTWLAFSYVNKRYFLLWSMSICIDYNGDIMVELPWAICWLFVGYMLVMWCILLMTLDMFWLKYEWLTNAWTNKCCCNYYERVLDLLDDSQISMRPLCSNMHLWPIDYMFIMCLTKRLSWLGLVRSSPCLIFVLEACAIYCFGKSHQVMGNDIESSPKKVAHISRSQAKNWVN